MKKLLIVDDHQQITSILSEYAQKEGYEALIASDGEEALEIFNDLSPEVILLDVMMPKIDGFAVCRKIRKVSNVPIIMITARGEDFEKIMGLEIGADDYIVKPFSPGEVMARIRAVTRRVSSVDQSQKIISFSNIVIHIEDYQVFVDKQEVSLTKKEFEIFWTLVQSKNKVFSRDQLLNILWGYDYYGDSRTVDSHIKRLRKKLDAFIHPEWEIQTIWGVGYKFTEVNNHE